MKKILSAVLVLTMVLCLGCSAFADNTQPTIASTIKGIYDMIVEKETSPVDSVMAVVKGVYDVASGNATPQEKLEEVNVLPTHVQYKSVNNFEHYLQIVNSDGEVLIQNAEAHAYGFDGVCVKCGHKFNGEDHIHTAAGLNYVALNSGFHEVQVVCACGEVISVEQYAHHNFDANGVCVDCGYGAKDDPSDPGEDPSDPGKDPSDPGKDPGNKGGKKEKEPVLWKEGDYGDNHYGIYLYPKGTPASAKTWEKANAFANGLTGGKNGVAGHLVSINSADEQAFLEGMNNLGYYLWIGAKRVDNAWTWVNDDEWDYENWADTFPVSDADIIYGAMVPWEWYNLVNEGTYKNLGCIIDGFIVEFENGAYGITLEDGISGEAAAVKQAEAAKLGDTNVEVSNVIASIEAETSTATASTPAWLYIVCAVAAMALAGGIVVIIATKKKAE